MGLRYSIGLLNCHMLLFRCSTERCQVAKPFDDSAIAPSPSPTVTTTSSSIPDLPDQICTDSEIRPNFWSAAGDNYCKVVCIGHPMEHCNLYLCTCTTAYFKE